MATVNAFDPIVELDANPDTTGQFVIGQSLLGGADLIAPDERWVAVPPSDVITVTVDRGRSDDSRPYDAGEIIITLDNRTGNYDPDNPNTIYRMGPQVLLHQDTGVRISTVVNGTTVQLCTGYVEDYEVIHDQFRPTVTFRAPDALAVLGKSNVPPQAAPQGSGDTSSSRISWLLDLAMWPTGRRSVQGGGRQLLATEGGGSVREAAQVVTDGEAGRFYASRAGVITCQWHDAEYGKVPVVLVNDVEFAGNIVPNPSFEVDLTGWAGVRCTTARITPDGYDGTAFARGTVNDSNAAGLAQHIDTSPRVPVTAGQPYTASAFMRAPAAWAGAAFAQAFDAGGSLITQYNGAGVAVNPMNWQRVSVTTPPLPANTATLLMGFGRLSGTVNIGDLFDVDAAQLQRGTRLSPYTTFPAGAPAREIKASPKLSTVQNSAIIRRPGLPDITAQNNDSVGLYGTRLVQRDTVLASDVDAADLATYLATRRAQPIGRASNVEVQLYRMTAPELQALLSGDLGSPVQVQRHTYDGREITWNAMVEGIRIEWTLERTNYFLVTSPSDTGGLYGSAGWFIIGQSLIGGTAVIAPF